MLELGQQRQATVCTLADFGHGCMRRTAESLGEDEHDQSACRIERHPCRIAWLSENKCTGRRQDKEPRPEETDHQRDEARAPVAIERGQQDGRINQREWPGTRRPHIDQRAQANHGSPAQPAEDELRSNLAPTAQELAADIEIGQSMHDGTPSAEEKSPPLHRCKGDHAIAPHHRPYPSTPGCGKAKADCAGSFYAASNSRAVGLSCSKSIRARSCLVNQRVARGNRTDARHSSCPSSSSKTAGWI